MNFRPHRENKPELNLIPMIDVLIVLLIFLVLTTTFSREASLRIDLPEASAEARAEEKGVEIVIDAEGHYVINRHQLINTSLETVQKALREAAGDDKNPAIVISADRKTPHQAVITALDAASRLGFVHITFAAESMPGEDAPAGAQ
jgi:biopolymer transport protein ExbD